MANKIKFNNKVFDKIDNVTAYFLGVYYADGCICSTTKNRKIISIGLNDIDTVEKICHFYGINCSKIKRYKYSKEKTNYRLQVCDEYLYERLKKRGCVAKKSNIVKPPRIPKKYYYAFLMGLFDGDGSISCNRSINQWKASLGTCSLELMSFLISILEKDNLIYSTEKREVKNGKFYVVTLNGMSSKIFLQKLYDSVPLDLSMLRKRKKYEELSQQQFKCPRTQKWEEEYMRKDSSVEDCYENIINDKRNFGWKRPKLTIQRFKRKVQNERGTIKKV